MPTHHLPEQAYFFPKSDDPTLKRTGTWKIARQMTFHLAGDDEEDSEGTPKEGSTTPAAAAEADIVDDVETAAAKV